MSFDDSWREPGQTTRITRTMQRFFDYVRLRQEGAPEEEQLQAQAAMVSSFRSCIIAACKDEALVTIADAVADEYLFNPELLP